MPVNSVRADYKDMLPKWERLRDCFCGRDAVIKRGAAYVPDLPGGDRNMNHSYRARGNFFNATKRTVQGMTGAIFQSAPKVDFPKAFEEYLADITLTNVTFQMFMQEAGRELMHVSRYGVLVDMPQGLEGTKVTARPYCVGYKAEDIINWRTERRGGDEMLVMVVLREQVQVTDAKDEFCSALVEQYRVLELKSNVCVVQLYRKDARGNFVAYDVPIVLTRKGRALDFIPFIIMGATTCSCDLEEPSLIDLADVNLAHFRNSVDHEWGLHLVALPTPWVSGVQASNASGQMKIGPSVVWELQLQGSAGMLEFSGQGLGALVKAMDMKEKQMAVLGARLLEDQAQVQETAKAVTMRHGDEHATIRTVAQAIEQGFTLVLQFVAWWAGTDEKPTDTEANVELNKEYMNVKASPQEIQVALTAFQAGAISFDTFWNLITIGGWGREGIDAAAERTAIANSKSLVPEPPTDPALSPDDSTPPADDPKKTVKED
jgi:hypothetical protein